MTKKRLIGGLLVLGLILLLIIFDAGSWLTMERLRESKDALQDWHRGAPVQSVLIFSLVYILTTALSIPGAAVLTMAAGAIFGILLGTLVATTSASLGAFLAFLISRYLFHDWVQTKFAHRLTSINKGVEKDGAFYLFGLRLVPIFPFFLINILMGLTRIRAWTYLWVSWAGMLAGGFVYVNAGVQLASISEPGDILSWQLLLAFALLGVLPLVAKRVLEGIRHMRIYKKWPRPEKFDANLIVIGAGSAGLVASYIAAAVKARVILVEKGAMGGDCLNTGCVPSKALIRSARFLSDLEKAGELGIGKAEAGFEFAQIMERVSTAVDQVAPHDSIERYESLGVEVVQGDARVTSPYEVMVGDRRLTARNLVIASGAGPFVPPIPGIDKIDYLTSDNLWGLRECPNRLVILGGGPIGCELAFCFARFGSQVSLVEMAPRILIREDEAVSDLVTESMVKAGIEVLADHKAVAFEVSESEKVIKLEYDSQPRTLAFDQLLVAVGRKANVSGFGLEDLGVEIAPQGTLAVNELLQTNYPNIYACGDVAGPYQFTHAASHQAWYASVNALFGGVKSFRVDYRVMPYVVFTDPEIARVGLNKGMAEQQKVPYEEARYELHELDRAIAEGRTEGFVQVLTVPGSDRILGATIVGEHAGELITEFVLAMKHNLGLNKLLGTIHSYPTWAEANKYVAGVWKRQHAPERLLKWVEKYHSWMRH